jgi:hypothetical protein
MRITVDAGNGVAAGVMIESFMETDAGDEPGRVARAVFLFLRYLDSTRAAVLQRSSRNSSASKNIEQFR